MTRRIRHRTERVARSATHLARDAVVERVGDREAARERKRAKLLEAAIRVVRRQGPGVSMEAIAAEAGVTKPIIYRAFRDRDGLIEAVAKHFADEVAASIAAGIAEADTDRDRVRGAMDAYLSFIERDPKIVRFLVQRSVESADSDGVAFSGFVHQLGQLITQVLGEALRARGLDSGGAEPWAYSIVGAVHLAGDWWLDRQTMSRERLVEYLTVLMYDGLPKVGLDPAAATSTTEAHA